MEDFSFQLLRNGSVTIGNNPVHHIISISTDILNGITNRGGIQTWKFNRPHDQTRVDEIAKRYQLTGYIEGTIKLARINHVFVCYDGNHRRLAVFQNPHIYTKVILDIILDVTDEQVITEFKAINSAVPVSELYMKPQLFDIVNVKIRDYADSLCSRFPTLVKTSNNPKRPHFNRSTVESDIKLLWTEYKDKYNINVDDLTGMIEKLNDNYKNGNITPLYSCESSEYKCKKHGFFLFSASHSISRRDFDICVLLNN
jgi:hypothetical protein